MARVMFIPKLWIHTRRKRITHDCTPKNQPKRIHTEAQQGNQPHTQQNDENAGYEIFAQNPTS
jgi:hypothetical protein